MRKKHGVPDPWCCGGGTRTGAIAVGFANLVLVALVFPWTVFEIVGGMQHAFVASVVATLVFFVVAVANCCLIHGARTASRPMVSSATASSTIR